MYGGIVNDEFINYKFTADFLDEMFLNEHL